MPVFVREQFGSFARFVGELFRAGADEVEKEEGFTVRDAKGC